MPDNKLVIRRLPPSMREDDFLKQVSPLPNHDYFCFFESISGLGPHSYSRAYINFVTPEDMSNFKDRFDNYVFLDNEGHEYPAVVEQSLWHKSPKNGPFYKELKAKENDDKSAAQKQQLDEPSHSNSDTLMHGIEQDSDFIEFVSKLQAQKERPQKSPIQTLETNLDELTNAANTNCSRNKDSNKVITPLIGYVNQQKSMKSYRKAK